MSPSTARQEAKSRPYQTCRRSSKGKAGRIPATIMLSRSMGRLHNCSMKRKSVNIGGIDANGKATDNRTDAQKKSLRQLLGMLKKKCPEAVIQGHRDFSPDVNGNGKVDPWERIKECPCFDAKDEYKDLQP